MRDQSPCRLSTVLAIMALTRGGIPVGIASRIAELYEAKVHALLDHAEDPREMIDYSCSQQQDFLRQMRGAAVDLAASRKRAGTQEAELRSTAERLRDQAREAVAAGNDELGRDALRLRAETIARADDLAAEQAQLRDDQERLAEATRQLEARVAELAYRKEAFKAAFTAAEARAAAAAGSMSGGARAAADAERRAAEQAAGLQARAEALSEQCRADMRQPTRPLDSSRIQEQLNAMSREAAVNEDLAKIKEEISLPAGRRVRQP